MTKLCFFFLGVFLIATTQFSSSARKPLALSYYNSPVLKVYEDWIWDPDSKETFILTTVYNHNGTDTFIVLNSTETDGFTVRCEANYPIRLSLEGNRFHIIASSSGSHRIFQNDSYTQYLYYEELYFPTGFTFLTEKYTCRSLEFPERSSTSIRIYIPGEDLFIRDDDVENSIKFTGVSDSEVVNINIPCGISHPDISVTLSKLSQDGTEMKRIDQAAFDPIRGFELEVDPFKDKDPSGKYICTARVNDHVRVIQYSVVREGEGGRNQTCTLDCPENSQCVESVGYNYNRRRKLKCECDPFYEKAGWRSFGKSIICLRRCETNEDCPTNLSCQSRTSGLVNYKESFGSRFEEGFSKICENPCIQAELEGQCDNANLCKVENHLAKCNNTQFFN